ncbi:MAG: hypothetical protein CO094_08945 [Anaerolineae bacterium CG_4_9_14_3_um_filter_57_17]|nr:hypothetical protein [bacterium]NCT21683.1 hypothetical protein [bacterium]OIO86725.1 MAG: hypothetical protein AUK01_02185 [Anaerolineae bacterium CG2_30_57_67]PJB65831.1 MAG: hypothetical protein CO094_08945 [Anaerolineae bacterium CG_4_9_14_3_um_filter_57_17]
MKSRLNWFVSLFALVALAFGALAPGGVALAKYSGPKHKIMGYASVTKIKVLDNQPATFRITGVGTCDKVEYSAVVAGKNIIIKFYNVKVTNRDCGMGAAGTVFSRTINLGTLVPGFYVIRVNPDPVTGKGAITIRNFVAPAVPAAAPAGAPAAQ